MKTAAMISLYDYDGWLDTILAMHAICDHLVVRIDPRFTGSAASADEFCHDLYADSGISFDSYISTLEWNRWNWREEMLRRLDDVKPDLVLCPDEDEIFGAGLADDIAAFMDSDKLGMMFAYHAPLPTADGAVLFDGKPYPGLPHMKAFKWREGLTYEDYTGFARVTNYVDKGCHYHAKTQIWHYCCWSPEQRETHEMKW